MGTGGGLLARVALQALRECQSFSVTFKLHGIPSPALPSPTLVFWKIILFWSETEK